MDATPTARQRAETPLNQAISRRMLLFFIVGDVLGAGIYALVGEVGGEIGGAIWAAFLAALVLAVFTAFAYAELVTKYPQAAGAALYVNRAFRVPFLTFMVAFAVMCSGITSASTLARAFGGDYLSEFVELPTVLVAIAFLIIINLINFRGISESVRVNVVFTVIEMLGLILIVVIGVAALADGQGEVSRAFEFKEGESVVFAIAGGAGLAFFALIGFEDSVNVAEETQEPARDYPRSLFLGLLIAGAIYLLVAGVASMVVPTGTLAGSDGPLLEVVQQGPLSIDTKIFSAIALFALANGALINMIMASRLVYGMARQGIVPRGLGRVHPRTRTPWAAIILVTLIGFALVWSSDLSTLASMTVLLLLAVFVLVNVAVLVLRRDVVDRPHFHAPTVIPVVGALASFALMFTRDFDIWLRAGILLLIGVVLWFVNRALTGPRGPFDTEEIQLLEHPEGTVPVSPAAAGGAARSSS
ncbi:MAG: amino acid permease [Solirubrobacterales bacterium]|nr:amino acid permease [Solirubrobacterales bacterium]